jgi:hypothetical protein
MRQPRPFSNPYLFDSAGVSNPLGRKISPFGLTDGLLARTGCQKVDTSLGSASAPIDHDAAGGWQVGQARSLPNTPTHTAMEFSSLPTGRRSFVYPMCEACDRIGID